MSDQSALDLATMASKLGQMVRTSELKVAGKLLATARGTLHQLAEGDPIYAPRYEHVAELRNELMEPGGPDFDAKRLLASLLDEEKALRKIAVEHPAEGLGVAHALLNAAAAVVLVYCQDRESGAPLDF